MTRMHPFVATARTKMVHFLFLAITPAVAKQFSLHLVQRFVMMVF
jgi:hypothetical protein